MSRDVESPDGLVRCPYCGALREPAATVCPGCGHAEKKPLEAPPPPPTRPFAHEVLHAFVYPLAPQGLIVIAAAALYFSLLKFCPYGAGGRVEPEPFGYYSLGVLLGAFLVYYFFDIVQSSAGGIAELPKLFREFEYSPYESLVLGVVGAVVSFLPAILYLVLVLTGVAGMNEVLFGTLRAVGCLYLPVALLSLAIWRDLAAVLPNVVLPAAWKLLVPNTFAAIVLWAAMSLHYLVLRATWAYDIGGVASAAPFWLLFVCNLAVMYLYLVGGRIVGIMHWVYRHELGWFRDI